jgi:hypothetical protein
MALLKMSDISNPMKPFDTAAWWADVVLREFHAQVGPNPPPHVERTVRVACP